MVASDLGGSEDAWRVFVNAISLDVFKLDTALLAGGLGVGAERARDWIELAAERIGDGEIPLYLIPGVDDDPAIDVELTAPAGNPVNVDGRPLALPGGLTLIADSCRPSVTPPVAERIATLAAETDGPIVLMSAAPPYDDATAVGSREVEKAIRRLAPALSVHGLGGVDDDDDDDHPDPKRWIGDTLALTPGTLARHGTVQGFVVDLVGSAVRVARPFQI